LLEQGTNILFALGSKQTPLTSLATEFSLIPPPPGTPLLSHFPARSEPATLIPIPVPPSSSPVLSSNLAPVWFSGVPFALGNNPQLVPLLRAPVESFAADSEGDGGADALVDAAEKGGEGLWAGSQLSVAAGFQVRGGARAAWVGGVQMFSDELIQKAPMQVFLVDCVRTVSSLTNAYDSGASSSSGAKSGNERFIKDLMSWTFQESFVLRIDNTSHHRVGEVAPREHYTINDEIVCLTAHISGL
jgi:oligosaccharyltransferase complex subunit beta